MKTYKLKNNVEYEVDAESEDEAYSKLEERFATQNMTAENEFWDNIEIEEVDDIKEIIIERLKKDSINNVDEAIKFLEEKEGVIDINEVDWKWEIKFQDDDIFRFYSDEELINWCREQRDTYFSEEESI